MVCRLLKKFSKVGSRWKLVESEMLITFLFLDCCYNSGYRLHFSCKRIKRRYDGNKYDRYDDKGMMVNYDIQGVSKIPRPLNVPSEMLVKTKPSFFLCIS